MTVAGKIVTYSGLILDPINPDPQTIEVKDIAHSLACQSRFTGHTYEPYSVAQHSVAVSELVAQRGGTLDEQKWGLLHDASEAYLSDISRPIKMLPGFGEAYREVENGLMKAIVTRYRLPEEMPAIVKAADDTMLWTEARDLMPEEFWTLEKWPNGNALDERVVPQRWQVAEEEYLRQWAFLFKNS